MTLTAFPTLFNNPIGIDYQDTSRMLVASVNYFSGSPNNFDLIDPTTGAHTPFPNPINPLVANLQDEVKLTTVHTTDGGFNLGDIFAGNGLPGQILRISADGSVVDNPWTTLGNGESAPGLIVALGTRRATPPENPWVVVPETARLRGSLFQDRYGAFGGDLLVATGNEQDTENPAVGKVWRVHSNKVAEMLFDYGKHLEGLTTVPNDPELYGPLAGRVLAGDEDRFLNRPGGPTLCDGGVNSQCDGTDGRIIAVGADGSTVMLWNGATDTTDPLRRKYHLSAPVWPEDLDVVRKASTFYGIDFGDGRVLTGSSDDLATCGDVLITEEFPNGGNDPAGKAYPLVAGVSGLKLLHWDGTAFQVTPVATADPNQKIKQWEHVTFAGGVDCKPNLTITKVAAQPAIAAGATASFTIVATNQGPVSARGVVVTDILPAGLTWTASVASPTCVIAAGVLTCNVPTTLGPGASFSVTLTAPTTIENCTTVENTARVAATNEDPAKLDDNAASASIVVTCPKPNLTITKVAAQHNITAGATASFTIVATNQGPTPATGVVVTDTLPAGYTWTASVGAPICAIVSNVLTCNVPSPLAVGGTFAVTLTAPTTVQNCTTIINTARVSGTNEDPTKLGDNTATDTIVCTCQPPNLTITKVAAQHNISAGTPASFTIVVTNQGPTPATGVVLTDTLPSGYTWTASVGGPICAIVSNVLTCNVPSPLAVGGTFSVTLTAPTTVQNCTTITNTARVSGTNEDPTKLGDNTATDTIVCTRQVQPNLTITKVATQRSITPGTAASFNIVVTNQGPVSATGVVLTDTLPSGYTWTASVGAPTCAIVSNVLTCNVPSPLAVGGTFSVTVSAPTTAQNCATIRNTARVSGTNEDPAKLGDNTATDTIICTPSIERGDTATIGFWHNQNGQALILCNGGESGTALPSWLAANFPYLYGARAGSNNLTGKTNADVAALFLVFFNQTGMKTEAQVMGGALAVFVTNSTLDGNCAVSYGFNVGNPGTGGKTYNVGSNGTAIGLQNNTSYTIIQLLQQANLMMQLGTFDRNAFNDIFDGINSTGDII